MHVQHYTYSWRYICIFPVCAFAILYVITQQMNAKFVYDVLHLFTHIHYG